MLEAAGYPHKIGALLEVEKHLGVPSRTLSRWHNAEQNPPPDNIVMRKKIDLRKIIKDELSAIAGEFDNTRQDANYRELATAFGILVDKLQLLEDNPTQIIGGAKNSPLSIVVKYAED